MRTTVVIDDDVAAEMEAERRRTGETFKEVLNRLLRRSLQQRPGEPSRPLPLLPGRPSADVTDVSAVLGAAEDEALRARQLY